MFPGVVISGIALNQFTRRNAENPVGTKNELFPEISQALPHVFADFRMALTPTGKLIIRENLASVSDCAESAFVR